MHAASVGGFYTTLSALEVLALAFGYSFFQNILGDVVIYSTSTATFL